MLQKTTLAAVLALSLGAGAFVFDGSGTAPLGPKGERVAAWSEPAPRVANLVRVDVTAAPAAPGGGATSAGVGAVRAPATVAVDDAILPLVEDALRVAGNGRFRIDDVPRADVVLRVLKGASHAAIATREPTPGERRRGIGELRLGDLVAVVVTHPDNPLRRVSSDALREVLRGAATDWAALGGAPGPLRLILPPAGPQADLFARMLVRGDSLSGSAATASTDAARMRLVAADPAAMTVVSLEAAQRAGMPCLTIDGAVPSRDAYRSGTYPFAAPIVLVQRGSLEGRGVVEALRSRSARDLLGAHLSLDGR